MYYIEKYTNNILGWFKIPFTEHKNRTYCDGYVDAIDSMYPSQPMRIVKQEKDGTTKIVRETKGRGEVHVN
jgi:hypothetical protein